MSSFGNLSLHCVSDTKMKKKKNPNTIYVDGFGDFLWGIDDFWLYWVFMKEWMRARRRAIGIWAPKCHVTGRMHYPFLPLSTQFVGSVRPLKKFVIRFFFFFFFENFRKFDWDNINSLKLMHLFERRYSNQTDFKKTKLINHTIWSNTEIENYNFELIW